MLITVIAPEILIGKYWADIRIARTDLKKMEKWARVDEVPWTLSHSLFANMGGFCLRTYAPERVGKQYDVGCQSLSKSQDGSLQEDLAQHLIKSVDQGTTAREAPVSKSTSVAEEEEAADPPSNVHPNVANPYHLDVNTILQLRDSGALNRLPYLSIDELQDRSKSDSLIRLIAIGQILWIIIQIIARAVRRLAISQLEVTVLAFACCAVVIYGLNWNKPKAVGVPITILSYRGKAPRVIVKKLFEERERKDQPMLTDLFDMAREHFGVQEKNRGAAISNGLIHDVGFKIKTFNHDLINENGLLLGIGSLIFGGVHLIAWKFEFPTRIEQILWWSAALWCTCFGFVCIVLSLLYNWLHKVAHLDKAFGYDTGSYVAAVVLGGLYVLARLYLVVETFRTLCFLPPDAYIATWATNVPHVV